MQFCIRNTKQIPHPFVLLSVLMRSMTELCHSWEPWHMFKRATFMPLTASISSISSEHVAGPIVAMILVRLVLLKPANRSKIHFLSSCSGPRATSRMTSEAFQLYNTVQRNPGVFKKMGIIVSKHR